MEIPFSAFDFLVNITAKDLAIEAGFAECSGLEISLKPFTLTEGGNPTRQIHLPGDLSYGQVTLKRGLTTNTGLWDWFEKATTSVMQAPYKQLQADVSIEVKSSDGTKSVIYGLYNCHPVRLKAPPLDAAKGGIAIEELQLAYEWMHRRK